MDGLVASFLGPVAGWVASIAVAAAGFAFVFFRKWRQAVAENRDLKRNLAAVKETREIHHDVRKKTADELARSISRLP